MTQTTKQTTEFFATTLTEAEGIVTDMKAKHSASIVSHAIARKTKKDFEYFVVKVVVEHVSVKELLEDLV